MRRSLFLAAALAISATTPAFAGPPWISIELPANPYNSSTKDAFCLVRVYHHGDPAYYPVSGTAEGLVNGQRRSIKLTLIDAGMPGVYAVRYQPETTGTWALVFRAGNTDDHGTATVVVTLGKNGQILSAKVPMHQEGQYQIPDRVSGEAVDRLLKEQAGR
jgi:hypothetical protein